MRFEIYAMNTDLTVMVVEDEELLLTAIAEKLKRESINAILCKSGKEAIEYLGKNAQLPSVIWLDYYLKDMDGLAFMSVLKNETKWREIPVVVISNSASTEKVSTMLALGAKKYLLKAEYRLDDIIKIIREL